MLETLKILSTIIFSSILLLINLKNIIMDNQQKTKVYFYILVGSSEIMCENRQSTVRYNPFVLRNTKLRH